MNRGIAHFAMLVALFVSLGCSSGFHSPVVPDNGLKVPASSTAGSSKAIWGVWEVVVDTSTLQVSVIPLRGIQYTVDVVKFLQQPAGSPTNLQVKITDASQLKTEGLMGVDVGFIHPFPGYDVFTGFDVMGVFVAPGSMVGQYDPDVKWTNGDTEPKLLNADGYTRWMNPTEFPSNGTIFKFMPGKLGNQNTDLFTSTINGYKYFADGLGLDDDVHAFFANSANASNRGLFRPGSSNHRQYDLKFPMVGGNPSLAFQYAVVANWVQPDKSLSGDPGVLDIPGDFPVSANEQEPFSLSVTDSSTLSYDSTSGGGGDIHLALEVYDWGALQGSAGVPNEIHQIVVEGDSSIVPGGMATFDQSMLAATAAPGTSIVSSVFQIDIPNITPNSNLDLPLLITIESETPSAFDPGNGIVANSDRLASYFLHSVPVGTTAPTFIKVLTPNGGEKVWEAMAYTITWDPGSSGFGEVKIEWSTDDFVSDIKTIVASTPNDGSYDWKPIPVSPTTTAKVRITAVGGSEFDISDDYFEIALPVWLEFQPEFKVDSGTVSWNPNWTYQPTYNGFSPAIEQDTDGMVHVCFYDTGSGASDDPSIRSSTGTSWEGDANIFGSTSIPCRYDSAKIVPGADGTAWFTVISTWGAYWCTSADRMYGGPDWYTFDAPVVDVANGKFVELASDKAGYLYFFADANTPNIKVAKSNQVGLVTQGFPGQVGAAQTLVSNASVSHSRSWARQGDGLAFIYYTPAGQVMLAETTDAPNNMTWDVVETVWDGTSGYTGVHDPAICADSTERLFAVWVANETSSGQFQILSSMRATPASPWTTPSVVATSATDFDDVHISSSPVLLPGPTTQDVAVVGWWTGDVTSSALSPMDMMLFLPSQQVSAVDEVTQDPDVICTKSPYTYNVLFAYSWDNSAAGNSWDISLVNANFKTP